MYLDPTQVSLIGSLLLTNTAIDIYGSEPAPWWWSSIQAFSLTAYDYSWLGCSLACGTVIELKLRLSSSELYFSTELQTSNLIMILIYLTLTNTRRGREE